MKSKFTNNYLFSAINAMVLDMFQLTAPFRKKQIEPKVVAFVLLEITCFCLVEEVKFNWIKG